MKPADGVRIWACKNCPNIHVGIFDKADDPEPARIMSLSIEEAWNWQLAIGIELAVLCERDPAFSARLQAAQNTLRQCVSDPMTDPRQNAPTTGEKQ